MATVSVVIPTYNDSDVLSRAIDSALGQTVSDIEVIVVDDASRDSPEESVEAYDDERLRYFSHDVNRGGSAARNTGIEHARGEYVAFLDADDEWLPTKLERQLDEIRSRGPEWIGCYCDADKRSRPTYTVKHLAASLLTSSDPDTGVREGDEELVERILLNRLSGAFGSTLVAELRHVREIGGFDTDFSRHQDLEFVLRLLRRGKLSYVDEPLVNIDKSSRGDAESLEAAKELLFEKFSEEISTLESEGHDVRSIHALSVAKRYFWQGEYRSGREHLDRAAISGTSDLLGVVWAAAVGFPRVLRRAT